MKSDVSRLHDEVANLRGNTNATLERVTSDVKLLQRDMVAINNTYNH